MIHFVRRICMSMLLPLSISTSKVMYSLISEQGHLLLGSHGQMSEADYHGPMTLDNPDAQTMSLGYHVAYMHREDHCKQIPDAHFPDAITSDSADEE